MASAREIWAKRVRQWIDSGLTAAEFAARHGVNARTLTYWKWRLGKEAPDVENEKQPSSAEPTTFVEVSPPSLWWRASDRIEIAIDDSVVVRVPNEVDAETLRRVLVVLDVLEES
jgi:transposase-like protein